MPLCVTRDWGLRVIFDKNNQIGAGALDFIGNKGDSNGIQTSVAGAKPKPMDKVRADISRPLIPDMVVVMNVEVVFFGADNACSAK